LYIYKVAHLAFGGSILENIFSVNDFDIKDASSKNRVKGLWRMLRGFRLLYLIAMICLGVSAFSKTLVSLLLRYFVDDILIQGNYPAIVNNLKGALLFVASAFLGLAILEGGFTFTSGRLSALTAESITRRLRNYLFDHIQRLTFTYHSQTQTGEIIQRSTSDVDALRRFFADQAIGVGRVFLLFTINFATLLRLNWQLALISIISVPFIIVVSIFFFKRVTKAYEAYQEQEATLSTTLQENLTGVRVVKAFARQEYERKKFEKDNWEKFLKGRKLNRMHSLFWPLSDILCSFQLLSGYLYAAFMVMDGRITIGTYLAYSGIVIWLIWPMRNLGRLIVQTSTGLVSYGRVMEIIKQEREPLDEGTVLFEESPTGDIKFKNVGFEYEEGIPTLHGISFECKSGQAVALLGPTGSGKSSLVNLLPRFYDYTSGHIYLDGIELIEYPRRYLRKHIGIVEQEPFLFSRTIRENITYGVGRDVPQEEVESAAKAAAIHDAIIAFPEGYDTLVGEKGVTLSGGQKQRVTIARTILKNPRILILDDSTSSVDTETETTIREALQCLMKERTTFIIAHRIQSVMKADLILVLDKGQIVQKGTHADLVNQDGIYKQIYEIQTRIEVELEKEIALVQ
jgi:ATP-binding cassette subfamily B protein